MEQAILDVLNTIQQNSSSHQKYLKVLENVYNKYGFDDFITSFLKFLRVAIFKNTDNDVYVVRTLEFFAKFVTALVNTTENQSEDSDDSVSQPILQCVITETLKYHDAANTSARYHSCKFISLILHHVSCYLDSDLCDEIQEAMLHRVLDPKPTVRLEAVRALARLQEPKDPECPIVKAYLNLMCDANAAIRREIIKKIGRNSSTISRIKYYVRDENRAVRMAAFERCAEIGPKLFSIEERQYLITCGFIEKDKQIQNVFVDNLLPKWLSAYNGDILDFLYALKLDAKEEDFLNSEDICKKVMDVLFKTIPIDEILSFLPIGDDKLVPLDKMTSHTVVYWSILVHSLHCDKNDEDIESIRPELTFFSNYIESYVKKKNERTMDPWEYTEYQYVLYNLFEMTDLYDISEEVGRRALQTLVMSVLQNYKLEFRTLCKVMKIAEKFVTNIDSFVNEICEIIGNIHKPLVEQDATQKSDDMQYEVAVVKVKLYSLENELEAALAQKEYQKCSEIQVKVTECRKQLEQMQQPQKEKVQVTKDDPETICRCLDILTSMLMLDKVKSICVSLQTIYTEFLKPLITSNLIEVHWRILKCLMYYCLMDKEVAQENAKILSIPIATYRANVNYNKMALIVSITAITDLARLYGPSIVGAEEGNNTTAANCTKRRLLRNEDGEEDESEENKMTFEVIMDMLLEMFEDECEDVRDVAVTAIGHLIFHFPVTPMLMSRLILKWFNPIIEKSAPKLQLKIGHLLDCYKSRVKDADTVIGKSLLPIVQKIASAPKSSPLAEIDIDNAIKFVCVMSDSDNLAGIHRDIASEVLSKIKSDPSDDIVPALSKILIHLNIPAKEYNLHKELITTAELLLSEDIDLEKTPKRNILKFVEKLKALKESAERERLATIAEATENSENDQNTANTEQQLLNNSDNIIDVTPENDQTTEHPDKSKDKEQNDNLETNEKSDKGVPKKKMRRIFKETSNSKEHSNENLNNSLTTSNESDKEQNKNKSKRGGNKTNSKQNSSETIIQETPPEESSIESISPKRSARISLRNQIQVHVERADFSKKLRNNSQINNKNLHVRSRGNGTSSSEDVSPKRQRISLENGRNSRNKKSTQSELEKINNINKNGRTRSLSNNKAKNNVRSVETTSSGSRTSSRENSPSQMSRRSQRVQKNVQTVEKNKVVTTKSRNKKANNSKNQLGNASSMSDFSDSKISRPIAESTRNNISRNASGNLTDTSSVVNGVRSTRKNNLHNISEESFSSSVSDQTKRKKTRSSQRLSQKNISEVDETVLHTIIEESQRMDRLSNISNNSVFDSPEKVQNKKKTVETQTSSDSEAPSPRKSTRKLKKKRMDGYVK